MKTTALLIAALVLSMLPVPARAEEAPPKAPATQPTAADIPSLVGNLGHDNPKTREQASIALRKLGKEALPALAKAKESDDPEVSTRAEAISKQIEEDLNPKPQPPVDPFGPMVGPGQIRINGLAGGGGIIVGGNGVGGAVMSVRVVANGNDNSKSITVKENDRAVNIEENKDGIKMTVTQPDKDGKQETKEYKAKDADTLKKEHPDAYEIYEKYNKGNKGGVQIQINNGALNLGQIEGINEKEMRRVQKLMEKHNERMQEMMKRLHEDMEEIEKPLVEKPPVKPEPAK